MGDLHLKEQLYSNCGDIMDKYRRQLCGYLTDKYAIILETFMLESKGILYNTWWEDYAVFREQFYIYLVDNYAVIEGNYIVIEGTVIEWFMGDSYAVTFGLFVFNTEYITFRLLHFIHDRVFSLWQEQ